MKHYPYRLFALIMLLFCLAFGGGFFFGRVNNKPTGLQKVTTKYLNNRDIIIIESDSSIMIINPETMKQATVKTKGDGEIR